jgi:ABC-type multidrug transport system ATPase subunit
VFGFLGPNGAGKTTAMRAVVGVTSLDAGTVRWHGKPIGPNAAEARKAAARSGLVSGRLDAVLATATRC